MAINVIIVCAGILNVLAAGAVFVSLRAAREKQLKNARQRVVLTEAKQKRQRSHRDW